MDINNFLQSAYIHLTDKIIYLWAKDKKLIIFFTHILLVHIFLLPNSVRQPAFPFYIFYVIFISHLLFIAGIVRVPLVVQMQNFINTRLLYTYMQGMTYRTYILLVHMKNITSLGCSWVVRTSWEKLPILNVLFMNMAYAQICRYIYVLHVEEASISK